MRLLILFLLTAISPILLAQPAWDLVTYTNSTTAYGIVTIDGNQLP